MGTDIKKSEFIEVSTVNDDATFDFVYNGTNQKIKKSDLVALFGVLGTLVQKGPITGTPVLQQVGTENQIRNIVDGPGVKASVGPSDGCKIEHDFLQDTSGVALLTYLTSQQPIFRSIIAGTGINVSATNGAIQIALSATPTSNKTVIVNSIADFPTAVGGVITLDPDTQYYLVNDVVTSNRFVFGSNTALNGASETLITLEYTGIGVMITAIDVDYNISDMSLRADSGIMFNSTDSTKTHEAEMMHVSFYADTLGTVGGQALLSFDSCHYHDIVTDGFAIVGDTNIINFFQNFGSILAGTFIDLGTATFDGFTFSNSQGTFAAGATFLSGLADSGNVNAGGLATVINNKASGLGTTLSGITTKDSLWSFFANVGLADSRSSALIGTIANTVTIAAQNTPTLIGGTWTAEDLSRFSYSALEPGRLTYTGIAKHATLQAAISGESDGGTDECNFYFYINGVQEAGSIVTRDMVDGKPGSLTMLWSYDFTLGDYLEIYVENTTDTSDILIVSATIRIS